MGAAQPASPSQESTPTDWGSATPVPRHYARHPAQREQGTVRVPKPREVADAVRYMKCAGRTRGGREWRGTHPFRHLLHKGPEMAEDSRGRMLEEALPGLDLDGPRERGRKSRVQMLRELLQREGWY